MTTIACRDNVMASDSGAWIGDACVNSARKVAMASDGTLYGVAGNAAECSAFIAWVDGGRVGDMPAPRQIRRNDDESASSFIVLVSESPGRFSLVTAFGTEEHQFPYFAIGAGSVAALGAMYVGADAEEAIKAALEHANGASGPVQAVRR